jgi:hypothetical protein
MSERISGQGPAVVLRSQYMHVRTLFAVASAATVALAIALVLVVATGNGGSSVAHSASAASKPAISAAPSACGVHYAGSSLVRSAPCPGPSTASSSACGTRYEGSTLVHGIPCRKK